MATAHFDGRVFVPDGPVSLPVGHRVRVIAEPIDDPTPPLADLLTTFRQLPDNPDWPPDGAAQHDHYLHVNPRVPE